MLVGKGGLKAVGMKEGGYVTTSGVVMRVGIVATTMVRLAGWGPKTAAMSSLGMVLFGMGVVLIVPDVVGDVLT